MNKNTGKVGRPKGYVMDLLSKKQISDSKTNHKVSEFTRAKISSGVKREHQTGAPISIIMNISIDSLRKIPTLSGYVNIKIPNPAGPSFTMREHVFIIEKELGRKLRGQEQIHHWGEKNDNRREMISLCPNKKYHCHLDRVKRWFEMNNPKKINLTN